MSAKLTENWRPHTDTIECLLGFDVREHAPVHGVVKALSLSDDNGRETGAVRDLVDANKWRRLYLRPADSARIAVDTNVSALRKENLCVTFSLESHMR